MNYNLNIEKLTSKKDIPFNLLLLADETLDAIDKYINTSDIYIVKQNDSVEPIAVLVLQLLSHAEIEIKNIAVATSFQGNGIGSRLIEMTQQIARQQGCRVIWVGTADCATREINFYKKNGFKKAGFKKNFFIDNYADPIVENGTLLKDMMMLKMEVLSGYEHLY